jgi:hypothetical protein
MTVLHLGVVDQPYRHIGPGYRGRGKKRRKAAMIGSKSTYEVAMILEAKYHIMETFYEAHQTEIVQAMIDSYEGATETVLMTHQLSDPSGSGIAAIQAMFNKFLDEKEIERLGVPGVPTLAAIHGVSHRFAHPYARGRGPRPSFIDTGLYEASFRAWVD